MTRADAIAFFTIIALLMPAVLVKAEAQQMRADQINQEQIAWNR